ncbi:WD40 repeat domain-containing protein [Candidatus Parabeggiatoa sp. HSG14]|uniref:WD40 repeat domain-containing protein n=1 Tax=Candidatus Parabeggiatoa sp. HSG14 TaxID=3055593 RepID=UPI0025A7E932|nr:WD40 repeat domain-containing protein [Thiotrichales bacterium HSG14]
MSQTINCHNFTKNLVIFLLLISINLNIGLWLLKQYADQLRDKAYYSQSLFLADLAQKQVEQGNAVNGILLALEALPEVLPEAKNSKKDNWTKLQALSKSLINPKKPYTVKAKMALYNALLNQRERLVLRHRCNKVYHAAFSPDGQYIISGSCDDNAYLWDVKTGTLLEMLEGHKGNVNHVAFSSDGERILTASEDKTIRLWYMKTGKQFAVIKDPHTNTQIAFSVNGQRILSFSEKDYTAYVWDGYTGKKLAKLSHYFKVRHAAFSPDAQFVVTTTGNDKKAYLWNVKTGGKKVTQFKGHQKEVFYANFSPNGQRVITSSNDNTVRVWDIITRKQVLILKGHKSPVELSIFSPDGQQILTTAFDKTIRLWDSQTGKQHFVLKHQEDIGHAIFSPDGQYVLSAPNSWNISKNKTIYLWDVKTGKQLALLQGHEKEGDKKAVNSIAFSSDGQQIVTTANDFTARLWNVHPTKHLFTEFKGKNEPINHAAFSPDGRYILTASGGFSEHAKDFTVRVWNVKTGKLHTQFKEHQIAVVYAAFSPDGQRILSLSRHPFNFAGGKKNSVRIWNINSGKQSVQLTGHEGVFFHADWSPDGHWIVTSSDNGTARLWNSQTGRQRLVLRDKNNTDKKVMGRFSYAKFSPDGKQVLTTDNYIAIVWDSNTGQELFRVEKYKKRLTHAAFSPNGQQLVTTYRDHKARIWNISTGEKIIDLVHDDDVIYAVFSPDSRYLVTTANDHKARLWHTTHKKKPLIAELKGHEDMVWHAAFNSNGRYVVTGSADFSLEGLQDMTARLWDVAPPTSKTFIERLLTPISQLNEKKNRQLFVFAGHKEGITSIAFSPDDQYVLTSSKDGTARLWRILTTQALIDYAYAVVPRQLEHTQSQRFFLKP